MSFLEKLALAALLGLVVSAHSTADAAPTLQKSIQMLRRKQVRTDVLLIKYRDDETVRLESIGETFRLSAGGLTDRKLEPVFRPRSALLSSRSAWKGPGKRSKLENYFYLRLKKPLSPSEAERLLTETFAKPGVQYAMFEPVFKDATVSAASFAAPSEAGPLLAAPVPSFEADQFYLDPAPRGVDARYAWRFPGGDGSGLRVIDIEMGWNASHVEFDRAFYSNGTNLPNNAHGTAVWGQLAARNDGSGVTGVVPEVDFGIAGVAWNGGWDDWKQGLARVIDDAVAQLRAGDVLLLEQHGPGPTGAYIPAEWYPPVFEAVRAASDKGVIVVAAAGNGGANLDDAVFEGAFDLSKKDSGSIVVGAAGAPTSASAYRTMGFSNHGARIDAYGYGEYVVTAGYGDLARGAGANEYYTRSFSGTSSAAPIVAGAVIAASGIARLQGRTLKPAEIRAALRATGTPQAAGGRVGTLPDLKALLAHLGLARR